MAGGTHNGFAVVIGGVALEKYSIYMARILLRHIQPLALASSAEVCHSTLIHVTHIIEFVAMIHVCIGLVARMIARITQVWRHYMMLVEVTIGGLRGGYNVDNLIHLTLQLFIFLQREQIGRTLHHLEQVGSDIVGTHELLLHPLATQVGTHTAQVLHRRGGLFEREWNKCLLLRIEAWQPEIILQRNLVERHLRDGTLIGRNIGRCTRRQNKSQSSCGKNVANIHSLRFYYHTKIIFYRCLHRPTRKKNDTTPENLHKMTIFEKALFHYGDSRTATACR